MTKEATNKSFGLILVKLLSVMLLIGLILFLYIIFMSEDKIKYPNERAQISQIRQFDEATSAFKAKYGAFPGDLPNAIHFDPNWGNVGNGDGIIQSLASSKDTEAHYFWKQLSDSELIKDKYNLGEIPKAKLGDTNVSIGSYGEENYYIIGVKPDGSSTGSENTALTPHEAFSIDAKMDDMHPNTGTVRAVALNVRLDSNLLESPASLNCVSGRTPTDIYKVEGDSESAARDCTLIIKMNYRTETKVEEQKTGQ